MTKETINQNKTYKKIQTTLLSDFFWFWIKQWKFTLLMMFAVIVFGTLSMINIKKESSPAVDMGMISVMTVYQWASPEDVDNLITDKIESEIKDIDGIHKITSSSRLWVSSINVELDVDADETQAITDIKDAVDKADLPSDAETPVVTSISTDTDRLFDVLLYGDSKTFSQSYILEKAEQLQKNIEWKWTIDNIDVWWLPSLSSKFSSQSNVSLFSYKVLVDKKKVEDLGLSIWQISNAIKSWNSNQPLWTHQVGIAEYDFRIQWEYKNIQDLLQTPISIKNWNILLKDIAKVKKVPEDENLYFLVKSWLSGQNFVTLTFNKIKSASIFKANEDWQKLLKKEFSKLNFKGLHYEITNNLADNISDDYSNLAWSGISTLILVFIALLLFVWIKEASIATIAIPLAFYTSFIVLEKMWLSLNFLTNFSFIVSFWVAIDTTLVIIEWAHEKMEQWYTPLNSIILSVRDYKMAVISGTATTVVVFIPLLTLPGVVWKFLAFIPITIFSTLLAALFFSLTVNSALFYKLFKNSKSYNKNSVNLDFIKEEDKILLLEDRKGKITTAELKKKNNKKKLSDKISHIRELFLSKLWNSYLNLFKKFFATKTTRMLSIFIPLVFLILSIVVLSKKIGFEMFPSEDQDLMTFTIELKKWTATDITKAVVNEELQNILSKVPEIKVAYYQINNEKVNWILSLYPLAERKKKWLKNVFNLQLELYKYFQVFRKQWIFVSVGYPKKWPPWGSSVAIKLNTDDNSKFNTLIKVAQDFKKYIQTLKWSTNTEISSKQNPGQFQYFFDKNKLLYLWLTPSDFQRELYPILNWAKAGSLKIDGDDVDIKVDYSDFEDKANPDEVNNIVVQTKAWPISLWAVSTYKFKQSLDQISREDEKITLSVGCDLLPWYTSDVLQKKLTDFASSYDYPKGISYSAWWERADNADLIASLISAFIFSLVVIFAILVLQFNSYSQPIIILFSIVMWMFGANLWLWITWNSYGMMMWIWFIALTGIVVNDAIVLIDKINRNITNDMPLKEAVLNAWRTRLQPVILTTLTTVLWLASLASNAMFQPLAVTIMFGLTVASTMTLFVIPIMYYEVRKLKERWK